MRKQCLLYPGIDNVHTRMPSQSLELYEKFNYGRLSFYVLLQKWETSGPLTYNKQQVRGSRFYDQDSLQHLGISFLPVALL